MKKLLLLILLAGCHSQQKQIEWPLPPGQEDTIQENKEADEICSELLKARLEIHRLYIERYGE